MVIVKVGVLNRMVTGPGRVLGRMKIKLHDPQRLETRWVFRQNGDLTN